MSTKKLFWLTILSAIWLALALSANLAWLSLEDTHDEARITVVALTVAGTLVIMAFMAPAASMIVCLAWIAGKVVRRERIDRLYMSVFIVSTAVFSVVCLVGMWLRSASP